MRLAIDLSSILWTCLRTGKDKEGQEVEFNGKKRWVNSAPYAYEFAINSTIAAMNELSLTPLDVILVQEGVSSKAPRLAIFGEYKKSSDKAMEEYDAFHKLRTMYTDAMRSVGATTLIQDQAEGDDVLGWLAKNSRTNLVIQTNDNDMQVLNGTNEHGAEIGVRVNGVIGQNKYGDFPLRFTTLYKALVGDSSDNIKGVPGFGLKAWEQLVTRFGVDGLELLDSLCRKGSVDDLFEDAQKDEFVKRIFDGGADMIRSYKLARIYPEWVDTMNDPLKWRPGLVQRTTDDRLKPWSAARRLIDADNWESFKPWALSKIKERNYLALDIETSTPDESDDWLAYRNSDSVDVIGSELTGMSLTFGGNMQFTVYISVDHKDTKNVKSEQVRDFIAEVADTKARFVIHNTMFEGPVLYNAWAEAWKDNGWLGFLPNWYDTIFAASYVDEDGKKGLKSLSKHWFDYDQVDYKTTTTLEGPFTENAGGTSIGEVKRFIGEAPVSLTGEPVIDDRQFDMIELRQFKMRELTAKHVFDYACDDTVCTAGFYVFAILFMELEGTHKLLEKVELSASYLHAHAFVKGANVSTEKLAELVKEDREAFDKAKLILDSYLISKGWDGTVCPAFAAPISAADIKQAHLILTGDELTTAVRTPAKVLALLEPSSLLHSAVELAISGDVSILNTLVKSAFTGAPQLNLGSPKQLQKLMYETMELPVQVYNMPTEAMRKRGEKVGTPKTDNLAITYALLVATEEQKAALEALRVMKMVNTRFSLYYDTIPGFIHWKTGRVHSSHNQCATNTRRASSSSPNLQQLSKNEKVEGFSPRVREMYVPHKPRAVIVSFDFSSQELVLMAEWSRDPALVACFVGSNPTDMHSTTGVGIHNKLHGSSLIYEEFVSILTDKEHEDNKRAKKSRALGKAVNFGSQYRIAAKKLSTMLLVIEEEAQAMLDAKAEAFPIVEEWSQAEMEEVKRVGTVTTMLGAVRHLREQVMSSDRIISSKAPRQALSFRIQGSAAEQTKLAECRMWDEGVLLDYDCEYFAAVHDECVWSVALEDAADFIPRVHALMTADYAGMSMPIRSSVSIGWDFGQQVELNGDMSIENIYKALGLRKEEA